MQTGFYRRIGKRLFDIAVAGTALIIFSPVLLITAILVRVFLGTPILFRQERPGRGGKPFRICKFRTMTDARDANGNLLYDDKRLTAFGRFLRASSLDELPELEGMCFKDLPESRQRKIKNRSIRGIVLNERADEQARFDIF